MLQALPRGAHTGGGSSGGDQLRILLLTLLIGIGLALLHLKTAAVPLPSRHSGLHTSGSRGYAARRLYRKAGAGDPRQISEKVLEEALLSAAQQQEEALDDELARLESLKADDLEDIRRKRLEQMRAEHALKKEKVASGHGRYELVEERDFFDVAKKSEYMVVHFFRSSVAYRGDGQALE